MATQTEDTTLYDFSHNRSFENAIERAETHPEEAKHQADDGNTSLHWLAYHNAPVDAVKAVVKAYPGTLQIKDLDGHTPLDIAVIYNASDETVEYLRVAKQELIREALENLFFLQTDVETLSKSHVSLTTKVEVVAKECDRLMTDNARLKNELEGGVVKNEQAEIVNNRLGDVEGGAEALRNDMNKLYEKYSRMEERYTTMKEVEQKERERQTIRLTREIQSARGNEINELKRQIAGLQEERDTAETERRCLRDDLERVKVSKEDIDVAKEENLNLMRKMKEKEVEELRTEAEKVVIEKKVLERQVMYLKQERIVLLKFRDKPDFAAGYLQDQIETVEAQQEKIKEYFESELQKIRKNRDAAEVTNHFTSFDSDIDRDERDKSDAEMDNHDYDNKSTPITEKDKDTPTSLFLVAEKGSEGKHGGKNDAFRSHHKIVRGMEYEILNLQRDLKSTVEEKAIISSRCSNLKAERLVLLDYRHGSELERRRVWDRFEKLQRQQNKLQTSFEVIEDRVRRRKEKKVNSKKEPNINKNVGASFSAEDGTSISTKDDWTSNRSRISEERQVVSSNSVQYFLDDNVSKADQKIKVSNSSTIGSEFELPSKIQSTKPSTIGPMLNSGEDTDGQRSDTEDKSIFTARSDDWSRGSRAFSHYKDEYPYFNFPGTQSKQLKTNNIFITADDIDFQAIADALRVGIEVKDRTWRLRTFKNCFMASEAVDFLVSNNYAKTRKQAVRLGQALGIVCNVFEHVVKEHEFCDEYLFFRFIDESDSLTNDLFRMNGYIDLDAIAESLRTQLKVRSRAHLLRNYKKCFLRSDVVTFLISNNLAYSRKGAVRIGRALCTICKIFQHVLGEKEKDFKDDDKIYRFGRPTGTKFGAFYSSAVGFGVSWRSNNVQDLESVSIAASASSFAGKHRVSERKSSVTSTTNEQIRKRTTAASIFPNDFLDLDIGSDEDDAFLMTANKQTDFPFSQAFNPQQLALMEGDKFANSSNDEDENMLSKIVEEGLRSLDMVSASFRSVADEDKVNTPKRRIEA